MSERPLNFSDSEIEELQDRLGYEFDDRTYLKRALTHSSLSHRGLPHNERLEFLGDSILETVVCEHLFYKFPEQPEGHLSELRSVVVSASSLYKIASKLELETYCRASRGIKQQDTIPDSIIANMVEAVIAAIYLDGGMEEARDFILHHLEPLISKVGDTSQTLDHKSLLQQYTQKRWNKIPHYNIISEDGPDHNKQFKAVVLIRGEKHGPGEGTSKQEAEENAARIALDNLDVNTSEIH